ncbi:DUF7405 family protein [Natronococcus jeotgali]|uniref:Tat pathway signal protein n=1 Tax=Natronococcus jeotgali DSM 18795 TaxID=1227498 RepID=L9WWX8_9EURY|nr:hypothetical protein [Natronococcus jeotgali]ELY53701.1 hypothetical protein C492_17123 [Natronococcus jeotgali DSM 18795]
MTLPDRSALSRREYGRALVAAGGAAALSACLDAIGEPEGDRAVPTGTDDPSSLPERQHAWNESLSTDADGNVRPAKHHVFAALSLDIDDVDEDARATTEDTLETLERAYERSADGLLFTLGYTPSYFDRFDGELPDSVDLPEPEPLAPGEEPAFDGFDAVLHLASDRPEVVLEAEAGLFGERETLDGTAFEADLSGVFDRLPERRRTGFVGEGLPADRADVSGVPESIPADAPFFMGFRSGFAESQAGEDRVTIDAGPFAGGTTQQLSSIGLQLEQWFGQENHRQRVAKLFSPEHDEEAVGEVGEALGATNGLTDERVAATGDHARERGVVGHAQKAARAREDGEPLLLRRDVNTVDGDRPGVHFLSLQREIGDFVRVREAMTGADLEVSTANSGIRHYLFVRRRGNYLVPPRSLRALPPAAPDAAG